MSLGREIARKSATAFSVAAVVVVGTSVLLRLLPRHEPRFDPDVWNEHRNLADEELTDQGDAIVATRFFDGKSREEVIAILGKPTFEEDDRMGYVLGPERRFLAMDREWLTMRFGSNGRVTGYHRWTD